MGQDQTFGFPAKEISDPDVARHRELVDPNGRNNRPGKDASGLPYIPQAMQCHRRDDQAKRTLSRYGALLIAQKLERIARSILPIREQGLREIEVIVLSRRFGGHGALDEPRDGDLYVVRGGR
jgi:hypothetical protein